jgi:N-methylhydantoinase A/oxoprolinase/acetone carboxylase beta subunit
VNIGIDVGGTYTDAVLLEKDRVLATAKVSTREDLLSSVLEALDTIMKGIPAESVSRVALSTTMITNLIAEKKYDRVGLLIMPGPGLSHDSYRYPTDIHIVTGAIDYRGREITPINLSQVDKAIDDLAAGGYRKVAIAGKFSCRNNSHEATVERQVKKKYPDWDVELGHKVAGQLNFPRRLTSTYLSCATKKKYQLFIDSVQEALAWRNIKAQVFILKADGGTLPLSYSPDVAIETIFSGPAASTLGVQALTPPGKTSVAVDIGGTTTDLSLILGGQPLLSSKGARIDDFLTHVRTLAVKSVPIGGDSVVERVGREIVVYSERMGLPFCLGGPLPTPTDALKTLGLTTLGDQQRARQAMNMLRGSSPASVEEIASEVILFVVETIVKEILGMFVQWEQEPTYRVWEVLQKKRVRPDTVVGVGGGASGFIPRIASRLGFFPVVPPYASVANAIGAAVARPTLQVSIRADTEQATYTVLEEGYQGKLEKYPFGIDQVFELAKEWLARRAGKYGLESNLDGLETTRSEVFNMVRDWVTVGRLYDMTVQTPRGILHHIGAEVGNNGN